ncbi:Uncharacterized membrane-anchored protein [Meinhardsimonia xiamenensis]|jgi:uncharacterized membrane-anchored protein|uniref:Uncharacterized membrane-anchored protein n=1 Tax=Meinhardsimonia xiamenensis TaxID=990712 RepID=A0A1G9FFI2_9RHOB|nr:DUF3422 domain-containing protein [Meinhardsimonia xiamenensis]PRX37868.1 putative membrane-anchored protein [Meinhardsimonia xiamenensis]SDK87138.1 Uncharacterized membrane-anchored protein [Meinhardsimonia xiamenensis]
MSVIKDHPLRYRIANELHARPFPALTAPCHAALLAIKPPQGAAQRDRALDRAHLIALLDRFGADHPPPEANHHFVDLGRVRLKWESHTEFVTYTIFADGVEARPFDPAAFGVFPEDWLAALPAPRLTSALIRVEPVPEGGTAEISKRLREWFVPESLAAARVVEGTAVVASDFRIDSAGHIRFAVFVEPGTGPRRVGRIVQRLAEIETYKAMAMLGLFRVRGMSARIADLEARLSQLVDGMSARGEEAEALLAALLEISSELETLLAKSSFRFGATAAYEAIVHDRIEVLREERFEGRQLLREFMMRRFDPAMRTVKSAERQLATMAERAARAGELLRTRVDVERSAQNQKLLASMDRRADLQLRLQKTVEGLSVVAISYYALNLAVYLATPLAKEIGIDKGWLAAGLTPPVVLAVWALIRRIRKHVE